MCGASDAESSCSRICYARLTHFMRNGSKHVKTFLLAVTEKILNSLSQQKNIPVPTVVKMQVFVEGFRLLRTDQHFNP